MLNSRRKRKHILKSRLGLGRKAHIYLYEPFVECFVVGDTKAEAELPPQHFDGYFIKVTRKGDYAISEINEVTVFSKDDADESKTESKANDEKSNDDDIASTKSESITAPHFVKQQLLNLMSATRNRNCNFTRMGKQLIWFDKSGQLDCEEVIAASGQYPALKVCTKTMTISRIFFELRWRVEMIVNCL